jgi:PAS domain S-box-containing protein
MFGFRIFDPLPLARRTAIDQLYTGMIALDPQGQVVSLNPSAERILGATTSQARNRPVYELLPDCSQELLEKPPGIETESRLGSHSYTLSISKLKDFRGLVVGYLLMLRDITEQKQAQAQIIEQQRALAAQTEREHMARELHDSLGQVLGYTSFQVGAAAKLSRDGQGAAAADQLDRLGEVVRGAHADLREHILNLRSTATLSQPFFPVVRQYLEGYSSSYEIQIHLEVDPTLNETSFAPEQQLQLFRILQEALSNARKHGAARQVAVTFAKVDGCFHLVIQDDGRGFDLQQVEDRKEPHYGLQFMRERAGQLNGSLQVQSAPGAGTCVHLEIPYKE